MITTLLLSTILWANHIINLPTDQLSGKATPPNVHTQWTYRTYDDSFYKHSRFAEYRSDTSILIPYFLTPERYYVGEDDYLQKVEIPAEWTDQVVTLELERVHIISHVYVNGTEARSLYPTPQVGLGCRSLGAPHRYDLTGLLLPGQTNEIRISIDNRLDSVPVGCNSYSVCDNDQGNWNGYIGKARLIAQPKTRLIYDATQVYPHVDQQTATVKLCLGKNASIAKSEKLKVRLQTEAGVIESPIVVQRDSQEVSFSLKGLDRLWDEYTPNLYHLDIQLKDKKGNIIDQQSLNFGMRELSTDEHFIHINGKPIYLRGTVDGAQFPLTGHPAMDREFWDHYFLQLKPWGINTVRFHSWCPPEAAFDAADSLGFYMQVESSSWPNHNVSLSPGNPTAQYIMQESEQILRAYGNHPSLVLLAGGNEPKGKAWIDFGKEWVERQKSLDPRHLYYTFAVGGSWPWSPDNQVIVRAGLRGLDWDRKQPESSSDFNAAIDTMRAPFVGHEIGQWCSYPALKDIPKFKGFMRPSNAIICRDMLQKNGLSQYADSFLLASGRLQVLCYKTEMERIRRTRHYGGYGLQALADYTGQGTSNEGILNVFGEPKGYTTPEEWLQWAGEVVPLMRTSRFCYTTRDTLFCQFELSNLGRAELKDLPCTCTLKDQQGKVLWQKRYPNRSFAWGGGQPIGEEAIALSRLSIREACQLNLQLSVGDFHNDWNIWVYPNNPDVSTSDIYVTSVPDQQALETLAQGGKVLMLCYNEINMGRNIKQGLLPEFWNHLWSFRYSTHTHGLLIQDQHPLFRHFPTTYHSDMQWWELVNRTYPIWLKDMPNVKPLIRTIDNAYSNRSLGMLFEVRVGKGRLIVTNIDLKSKLSRRIVARQLLSSILQYMKSEEFQPAEQVEFSQIVSLFSNFEQL